MKKNFLFLIFTLSSFFSYSQFDSVQVEHYYSGGGGWPYGLHWRNEIHFDTAGRILSSQIDWWETDHFNRSGLELRNYNSSGNQIIMLNQTWDSVQYNDFQITWTYYNAQQQIDSIINANRQGDTIWIVSSYLKNFYDANSFLILTEEMNAKSIHYPNQNGKDTSAVRQFFNGTIWTNGDSTHIIRDANSNPAVITNYDYYTGQWHKRDSLAKTFYPNDSLFTTKIYSFNTGSAVLGGQDSVVYDADTMIIYFGLDYDYREKYYNDGTGYNYYRSFGEDFYNGTWHTPTDYEYCIYDSTLNIATCSSVLAGTDNDQIFTFDTNHKLIHHHNESTSHSGNFSFGNSYYYYYLTHGPGLSCLGDPDTLSVSSGMNSYLWNNSDTLNYTIVDTAGEYYCDIINQWGYPYQSEPLFLYNTPNPIAGFYDTVVCTNTSILLYPGSFSSYQWNNGSTDSSITVFSSIPDSSVITVTISDSTGCFFSKSINVVFQVCANIDFNIEQPISVFPNPTSGIIQWNFTNITLVAVYNYTGQKILSGTDVDRYVDLSGFGNGLYRLVFQFGKNDLVTVPVMVMKH